MNAPWRYLKGAHESVQAVLAIFDDVHARYQAERGESRGTLRQEEQELLRAALVLTSSGLDASMTKLVRGALPVLIRKGDGAQDQYHAWLRGEVGKAGGTRRAIVDAVVATDPASALVAAYVDVKTQASYQGTKDLSERVRDLLCLPDGLVSNEAIDALRPFFMDRNRIVHDMDYVDVTDPSGTTRTNRRVQPTVTKCNHVLQLCAQMIEATVQRLGQVR